MNRSVPRTRPRPRAGWVPAILAAALASALLAPAGRAGDRAPFGARGGLEVVLAAARSWAEDPVLIYVENDEEVGPDGAAARWGYLFLSPESGKARAYSVRDGKILVAENLDMQFEAPPIAPEWMDSGAAFAAAEREAGLDFRRDHGGRLGTMLLMRGAFHDTEPDRTTWTLIYLAPDVPSLFVVVDAATGKVRRTWRG